MHTNVVDLWRSKVLDFIGWSMLGLSLIMTIANAAGVFGKSGGAVISVDFVSLCLFLALFLGLTLVPNRFFRLKAGAIIFLIFGVGFYFTYRFGSNASGPFWLFIVPMLTAIFFGTTRAIGSLVVITSTLLLFTVLLHQGTLLWPSGQVDAPQWAVIGAILVLLSALLSISIGLLLANVESAHRDREAALLSRISLQEQIQHSQKMEALGRLASDVSHDFNNLLTVIGGFANFAFDTVKDLPEVAEDLDEIIKATKQGHVLTAQLLSFSRKNPPSPEVIDISSIVLDTAPIISNLLGDEFSFKFSASDEHCFAQIDPDSLVQLLIEVSLNAKDAMVAGGQLHVMTERLNATEILALRTETKGDDARYILLSIKDNGTGINTEDLDKMFEPFFTTKKSDKGTGLGLSKCWAIMQEANGFINVKSEVGVGTNIECYFPLAEKPPTIDVKEPQLHAPNEHMNKKSVFTTDNKETF